MKKLFAVLAVTTAFTACKKDDATTPVTPVTGAYAILGETGTGSSIQSLLLPGTTLTEGSYSAIGAGIDVTGKALDRSTIVKDGYLYQINGTTGKFGKCRLNGNTVETVQEIPYTATRTCNFFQWIDDNTLLICNDGTDFLHFDYAIINTASMSVTQSGALPVPAPGAGEVMFMGTFRVRAGKLYVYYGHFNGTTYAGTEGARVAAMDYPAMTNISTSSDPRSSYLGGGYLTTPGDVQTEGGDIYAITCPGPWSAYRPDLPTAIYRIKAGETGIDPTYFFNTTTASGGQNQQGLWYLGSGKALTRSAGSWWDYATDSGFDLYVADLNAQTMTKLDVPRSAQNFSGNIFVKDGKAYIATTGDMHVYIYDAASGNLSKGASIEGLNSISGLYDLGE